jgi:signal transduction histidine kinase
MYSQQRESSRGWIWVSVVLALVLVLLAFASKPYRNSHVTVLKTATVVQLDGGVELPGRSQTVMLPHVLPESWLHGKGMVRYKLFWPAEGLSFSGQAPKDLAILVPRVGARFSVRVNGQVIHKAYWDAAGYVDTSVVPHLIALPPSLEPTRRHQLEIDVIGVPLRKSGLGEVVFGSLAELQDRHDDLYWWQIYLTWMVCACSAMLGMITGLIWWGGRERLFGWLTIAALAWAVRHALTPVVHPPMSFELWFFLHKLSFTLYCVFLYYFLWDLFRMKQHLARKIISWMLWASPFWLGFVIWSENYDGYRVWTGLFAVVATYTFVTMMYEARKGLDSNQRLMMVVTVVTLITGLRDFLVVQFGAIGDADLRWMTPGSLVFMLTLSLVLVQRMSLYVREIRQLNSDLEVKVQERERELRSAFDILRETEKQKVLLDERARLTRDMHDGLGSQLVQTLNAVRSGEPLPRPRIEQMLSHALEELRMTLDSMESMEGDLPALLGTLRARIAPALQASGIELQWNVEDVPALLDTSGKPLEAKAVMHLFRCLQEVFANIIKHSRCKQVVVSTAMDPRGVVLTVRDDGVGMERESRAGGRGLDNIRLRAQAIGATVDWQSQADGTSVIFVFERHA